MKTIFYEVNKINLQTYIEQALEVVQVQEKYLNEVSNFNTQRVLEIFSKHKVSDFYFRATSGYAYSDIGREQLEKIYADIFATESALVRTHFVSGTHAIATVLFGLLKTGEEIVSLTGTPYDTMQTVVGLKKHVPGSLLDIGVVYKEVPMLDVGLDLEKIKQTVSKNTKMAFLQRSRGYASRKALSIEEIKIAVECVKNINPNIICFVDNCYGEFVDKCEPTAVGADIVAGSLIKNIGGGLAPTGGYIAGAAKLVEMASWRLTAPGLSGELGASLGDSQKMMYQGLFLAPHVVKEAIKTAIFAAALFNQMGFYVTPMATTLRSDIVQAITFNRKDLLIAFCQAIQKYSPVDGHVSPIPGELPGYSDPVIMAAGTFVQGSSIELSADGPIREPYRVYLQGGLTFEHGFIALTQAAKDIMLLI